MKKVLKYMYMPGYSQPKFMFAKVLRAGDGNGQKEGIQDI